MRVPKETSSQPLPRTKPEASQDSRPARPKPDKAVADAKIKADAVARAQRVSTRLAAVRARTKQEDHVDGPRRLEGGITTPNGVAQVDPGYRNLNPTPPAPKPKYGKR